MKRREIKYSGEGFNQENPELDRKINEAILHGNSAEDEEAVNRILKDTTENKVESDATELTTLESKKYFKEINKILDIFYDKLNTEEEKITDLLILINSLEEKESQLINQTMVLKGNLTQEIKNKIPFLNTISNRLSVLKARYESMAQKAEELRKKVEIIEQMTSFTAHNEKSQFSAN